MNHYLARERRHLLELFCSMRKVPVIMVLLSLGTVWLLGCAPDVFAQPSSVDVSLIITPQPIQAGQEIAVSVQVQVGEGGAIEVGAIVVFLGWMQDLVCVAGHTGQAIIFPAIGNIACTGTKELPVTIQPGSQTVNIGTFSVPEDAGGSYLATAFVKYRIVNGPNSWLTLAADSTTVNVVRYASVTTTSTVTTSVLANYTSTAVYTFTKTESSPMVIGNGSSVLIVIALLGWLVAGGLLIQRYHGLGKQNTETKRDHTRLCVKCAVTLPPDAKFCDNCGAKQSEA